MSDAIDWKARCEVAESDYGRIMKRCEKAEAELERVQKLLGETMDHVPSELRTRIVSAVADAQAKGLL